MTNHVSLRLALRFVPEERDVYRIRCLLFNCSEGAKFYFAPSELSIEIMDMDYKHFAPNGANPSLDAEAIVPMQFGVALDFSETSVKSSAWR